MQGIKATEDEASNLDSMSDSIRIFIIMMAMNTRLAGNI